MPDAEVPNPMEEVPVPVTVAGVNEPDRVELNPMVEVLVPTTPCLPVRVEDKPREPVPEPETP